MNRILVDTDVIINFLRGREIARNFLTSAADDSKMYISAITIAEIYAGMKKHEREETENLLESFHVVDINAETARIAGELKNKETGQVLELDDCLIAACAISAGARLATGNIKHFPMAVPKKLEVD